MQKHACHGGGHTARLVTFSGIDGAGKTTQIDNLCANLSQNGYKVRRVAFWDDVAVWSAFRTTMNQRLLRKNASASIPLRNDKNVRAWHLTLVRSCFYFFDALSLRTLVEQLRTRDADFVVFDRYIYDQVVQIRSRNFVARIFIRLLLRLAPIPDCALILDASPDDAFRRKPEYPIAFMHGYRQSFLDLQLLEPRLVVIDEGTVERVHSQILQHVTANLSHAHHYCSHSLTFP